MSTPTRLSLGSAAAPPERLRRPLVLLLVASLLAGLGVAMPVVRERSLAADYVPGTPDTVTYFVSDGLGGTGSGCATPDASTGDYADDALAIQDALNLAATDGTGGIVVIHLCAGTFDLSTGVSITTGDSTTQTVVIEGEGTAATTVRLSAEAAVPDFALFTVSATEPVDTTYRHLTISGARHTGGNGGAVASLSDGSVVRVESAWFVDNSAGSAGGAIWTNLAVSVSDGTFVGNSAGSDGGAIKSASNVAVHSVADSSFADNTAGASGGAISIQGGSQVSVGGTDFSRNVAGVSGGAIHGTDTTLVDAWTSTFGGNFASGSGGAIVAHTVAVSDGTFTGNSTGAGDGGAILAGGAIATGGAVDVRGSTFAANRSVGAGGAIRTTSATLPVTVVNSTFVENESSLAAGGAISAGFVEITNGSFVDNTAQAGGHVSATDGSGGGSLAVVDTLFAGGSCEANATTTSGVVLRTDASCPGTGALVSTADLDLAPLADNGGPTQTVRPLAESVAIDAHPAPCPTSTDQRGEPRPAANRDACDIGAVEVFRDTEVTLSLSSGDSTTFTYGDTVTIVASVTTGGVDASNGTRVRLERLGSLVADCGLSEGTCEIELTDLEVGVYAYHAIFPGDLVWDVTTATISIEVLPRPLDPITTVETKTYDGTTGTSVTACELDGVVGFDYVTCDIAGAAATFADASAGTGKAVAVTGLDIVGSKILNYSFSGSDATTATITKRTVRLNADSTSKTYGTSDPALTATFSSGDFVGGETAGTAGVTGAASCTRAAGEAATTYAADCTAGTLTSTNYSFSGGLSGVLTIVKRTISVAAAAASKTYLGTDPVLGYGITAGSLVADDAFTGALGRVAGETAGLYDITQGTLGVDGPNGSANYTIVFSGDTFSIAAAASTATVTASPVSPVLVGTLVTFTVDVTSGAGVPDGTAGVFDGTTGGTLIAVCTLDGAGSCDVTTATLTVGTHLITVSYAGGTNHSGSDGTTTVVVSAPPPPSPSEQQTVTFAGPIGAVVGRLQTLRATASSGLAVQFASLTGATCSVAGTTLTPLAVGDCTIVATQGGSSIWAPAPLVTRTFPVAATLLPLTMRTSFLIGGEERLSVPIYVRKGTTVEMRLTTSPVLVGQVFEVWWRVGSGTWSKLTTRRVESSTRAARYTFTVRRDSVAYRWRFAGNELYQWQLAPGRRIFGL